MIFFFLNLEKRKVVKSTAKRDNINSVQASNINREQSWLKISFGPSKRKMCAPVKKKHATSQVFINFHFINLPVVLVCFLWFLTVSVSELVELGRDKSSLITSSFLMVGNKDLETVKHMKQTTKNEITLSLVFSDKVDKSSFNNISRYFLCQEKCDLINLLYSIG